MARVRIHLALSGISTKFELTEPSAGPTLFKQAITAFNASKVSTPQAITPSRQRINTNI